MLSHSVHVSRSQTSDPLTAVPVVGSLADALVVIQGAATLASKQKEDFAGAVRTICKLIGRESASIPPTLPGIDALLREVPHAVRTRSRKTLANVRSRLKAGLLQVATTRRLPPRGTSMLAS